jgi:hypothetical protein
VALGRSHRASFDSKSDMSMENNKICPICKGERFIKFSTRNENGYEYEIYKRCECMSNKQHDNPFDKQKGEKANADGDKAISKGTAD